MDQVETTGAPLGGFSLSNIQGPSLAAALIVVGAMLLLSGHYWWFRDVAQF
jgi:hypothetical protein